MTLQIDVRSCTAADWPAIVECDNLAFGHEMQPEVQKHFATLIEPSRLTAAAEAGVIVGTAATIPLEMTVPGGGELPTGGLTMVSVRPTHRRRGILRQLMQRQFQDLHERGEALSILWASEPAIYQRFGYGIGSYGVRIAVDRGQGTFLGSSEPVGRLRLLSHAEALELLPPFYERVRRSIPGTLRRTEFWWDSRRLADFDWIRRGGSQLFRVVLEANGQPRGYALYRVHQDWGQEGRRATWLDTIEALGATPAATRAIWEYLFSVDLVTQVRSRTLAHDHPLLLSVLDPRALQLRLMDGPWVRVVDVPAALSARTYGVDDALTFELADASCPWNDGVWQLQADGDQVKIGRATSPPELRLTASELSAMYLGGIACTSLLRAGRIEEATPGAAHRADLLFRSDVPPWCLDHF